MLKEERLELILNRLAADKKVTLKTLSTQLNVSEYTVRRDIKELSDQGLLRSVRGGAVPHSPVPHPFAERIMYNPEVKEIIAEKAVGLLKDGQVVILDGGTTTLAIASLLPRELRLTVVTNSFPIANVLEKHPHIDVLFAGGKLHKSSFTTVGHDAIAFMKNIRADLYFMGITSIHPVLGVTTIDYEESELKKAIVSVSKQVVAPAPHEKMNTAEAFFICSLSEIDIIITDEAGKKANQHSFDELGITVL
jgi:DeoR/GlpR family transcriptional regulator of sugar metabolism